MNTSMNFNVRVIKPNEKYGLNNVNTNLESEALVEFYDADYDFTEWGQFVARYNASTLLEEAVYLERTGLMLDGGVSKWKLTGDQVKSAVRQIIATLKES